MLQLMLGLTSSSCQTLQVLICRVPIILKEIAVRAECV